MKLRSALLLTALIGATSTFAATPPASAGAAPAARHMSSKACNKQADSKKLVGDARTTFVKECRAGKTESK